MNKILTIHVARYTPALYKYCTASDKATRIFLVPCKPEALLQFWKEGLYFALLICNVELHLKYLQFLAFFCKESFFQVRLVVGGGVSEKREEDKQLNILPRAAQQKTFVFHEECFSVFGQD